MLTIGREVRPHYVGQGEQLLVDDLEQLADDQRVELPEQTRHLFERWRSLEVPDELGWAKELLRRHPVLERTTFDERVYWTVRLPVFPSVELLTRPCFGADGVTLPGAIDLPAPLDWLAAHLGTASLVVEQSGTSPWGRPLEAWRRDGALLWGDEESLAQLPDGSDAWVSLYETDGDVVFADLATGDAYWVGSEWTGEAVTRLPLGWPAVTSFVLWRLLDGGAVRPSDLAMLAAAAVAR